MSDNTDLLYIGLLVLGGLFLSGILRLRTHYRLARVAAAAFCVYLLPLLLNVILPYEYAYPLNAVVAMAALCAAALFCFLITVTYGCRQGGNDDVTGVVARPWLLITSYAAVVFFSVELALNVSLRSANSLLERRDIIADASLLYLLATVLSGAALYVLLIGWMQRSRRYTLMLSLPWGLYSLLSLFLGNRQYLFMGLCIITLATIFRENGIRKALKYLFPMALLASFIMFALQYARGDATQGRQDLFFMSLFNISLKQDSKIVEHYALNTLGTTLYAYYGTQYHFLSFIVQEDMSAGAPLSLTFPLIYRRFGGKFGFPDAEDLRLQRLEENESALGFFPRSWGTMWADMFGESGWISLTMYLIILNTLGVFFGRAMCSAQKGSIAMISVLSCFAFGINFFVFKESFAYLFVALAIGRLGLADQVSRKGVS